MEYYSARLIANLWQNQYDRCMKSKLPNFTLAITGALLLAMPGLADVDFCNAQQVSGNLSGSSSGSDISMPGSDLGEAVDGERLVAAAAKAVHQEPAIKAGLRYRIWANGQEVVGSGSYSQLGEGNEKLLRLEMKSRVGDSLASLLEVCTSDYYWIRRELPILGTTLGRVSLRDIRDEISRRGQSQMTASEPWILLGGLPRLLERVQRNFAMESATPSQIEFPSSDGKQVQSLPVWIVGGKFDPEWKPEKIPTGAQIPDEVELVLGRVEKVLPLFPYRISYYRKGKGDASGEAPPRTPLMVLEFYGVSRSSEVDPREFFYNPGDQEVADLTTLYLDQLGLKSLAAPK